jgi:putative transposase
VFIYAERALYPVRVLCSVLGVSRSGYCAWIDRPKATRTRADEQLVVEIVAAHRRSRWIDVCKHHPHL